VWNGQPLPIILDHVDVIGLNCSTGPEHMREPIRYLSENATLRLSVIPNAGLPLNTGVGEAVYPLEPQPMADAWGYPQAIASCTRSSRACDPYGSTWYPIAR